MGIYDRDYYRKSLPRGGFGHFSAWSITTWLIVINVVVFFADGILHRLNAPSLDSIGFDWDLADPTARLRAIMGPLQYWGYFSIDLGIRHGQVWRFITCQFLHASPMHLLGNMVGLFFFGPVVEAHFGGRRYLAFYLLCGLAGVGCYVLLAVSHVLNISPQTPMVGASAAIFGLLVAAAMIAPDVELFYYIFPITIRTAAIIGMLMALYAVVATGYNAGGEAAHLGGGVLGFVLMKNQHWLNPFAPSRARQEMAGVRGAARRRRAFQKDWSKDLNR
jgi:membrane associated rhomboid family serine protease